MPSAKIALDLGPVARFHRANLDHDAETRLAAWSAGRRSTATARWSTGTAGSVRELEQLFGAERADGCSRATTSSSRRSRPRIRHVVPRGAHDRARAARDRDRADASRGRGERARALAADVAGVRRRAAAGSTEARERGWRLAILSNTDRDLIDASMEALGVPFDAAIVAGEIGSYKPRTGTGRSSSSDWRRSRAGTSTSRRASSTTSRRRTSSGSPSIWINRLGEPDDPRPTATLTGVARASRTRSTSSSPA